MSGGLTALLKPCWDWRVDAQRAHRVRFYIFIKHQPLLGEGFLLSMTTVLTPGVAPTQHCWHQERLGMG